MSDKDCVINPVTNRPIKKGGAIYNRLLKKGLLNNPKTDCLINEKTGRAVRASGKVGKKIAEKPVKPKQPVKPKEPNQQYSKPIRPVKPKQPNQQYSKPIRPVKPVKPESTSATRRKKINEAFNRRERQNLKKFKEAYEKKVTEGFETLVKEWDTQNIGILFYQIANDNKPRPNENLKNMIIKITQLRNKKYTIVPSDLFYFLSNPLFKKSGENLLDYLVDEYGADKKGIDIIDQGMRNIIKYIEKDAMLPDQIDYKYYAKYMNAGNKKKLAKYFNK